MSKEPRRVKLLVGFSKWAGPKYRKEISYDPDYKKAAIDGEIAFGNGEDRLSSGLIRFNKKGTKANIYWDKNLDGFVSGGDGLVGNITFTKSQAKWFGRPRGYQRQGLVVDTITGRGVSTFSVYSYVDELKNKYGNHNASVFIKNKKFLKKGTLVKGVEEISTLAKGALNYDPNQYVRGVLGTTGFYLETELGWEYDGQTSVVVQSSRYV